MSVVVTIWEHISFITNTVSEMKVEHILGRINSDILSSYLKLIFALYTMNQTCFTITMFVIIFNFTICIICCEIMIRLDVKI